MDEAETMGDGATTRRHTPRVASKQTRTAHTANRPARKVAGETEVAFDTMLLGRCLLVIGELDAFAVPRLHLEVATLEGLIDAIDLGSLTFIDSSGIRALVVVRRRYPTLEMQNPSTMARRLMEIVGVSDVILTAGTDASA
jgi:anti-anti-sigma regulatory factor